VKFTPEYIEETAPEAMKADGYDDCIVGIGHRCGSTSILIYDIDLVVKKLMKVDDMSEEDAVEFFEFNIAGSYVGEGTPLFMDSGGDRCG